MRLEISLRGTTKFRDEFNLLHRVNGPALVWNSAWFGYIVEWWIHGIQYTEEEYWEKVKSL